MHNFNDSELNPISLRAGIIAAIAAICVMALGFAPVPQLCFFLALGSVFTLITIVTGPKVSNVSVELPAVVMTLIPAVLVVAFRGTSLVWATVPVLAVVVAAATWMLVTNRYIETTVDQSANPAAQHMPADELAPKREEKTAVTDDETSATAA